MNRLQKNIISIIINLTIDKQDLKNFINEFKLIDYNNDGYITAEDLENYTRKRKMNNIDDNWGQLINKIGFSSNGKLSLEDFLAAAVNHQKLVTRENIVSVFKLIDTNNDGKIDVEDFKNHMGHFEFNEHQEASHLDKSPLEREHQNDDKVWKCIVKQLFANAKFSLKENRQEVSLEEFIQAIEKLIQDTWVNMNVEKEPRTPTLGNGFIQKASIRSDQNPDNVS